MVSPYMTGHNRSLKMCFLYETQFIYFLILHFAELLERVLFRLGTADSDVALENTVVKFLTPVLLKITSPSEVVRCKVFFLKIFFYSKKI